MTLIRTKTSEAVADHILGLLFDGTLRTGDRIDIDGIAASLGVSRVPVREGLQTGVTQANQELAKRVAEVKAAKR